MKNRKITILIVPDFEGTPYTFKISLIALRIGAIACVLGLIFFIVISFTWSGLFRKAGLADSLARENEQFREEQQRITELEARVQNLKSFEDQIRRALGSDLTTENGEIIYPVVNSHQINGNLYPQFDGSAGKVSRSVTAHSALPVTGNQAVVQSGMEIPSMWPVEGFISRGFEWNPVVPGRSHPGVDIAGREGAVVKATAGGIVVWSGWSARYGNLIVLAHPSGYFSVYGHNQVVLVEPRQRVNRGSPIALLGNTGQSSAPHLHFEIWLDNQPLDPLVLLSAL